MKKQGEGITILSNGEISRWIEQGSSIHLKAVTDHNDPVELSAEEASELSQLLLDDVARLENIASETQDKVQLIITKDEALVLFALLSQYNNSRELKLTHLSERRVLWNLQCLLEKCLVEPFRDDYDSLLAKARLALITELDKEDF